jgi:hypothetical protein
MKLSVQVDTGDLEAKLYLLAKEARVAPGVVIKEETKGICRQIMQLTPPRNLAQGRKAVFGDLSRIVYAPRADEVKWAPLAKATKARDVAVATALYAAKRSPRFTFTSGTAEIRAQHLRMRNHRGRVNKGVKTFLAAFSSDARKYISEVQSRVGWAKASFARTLIAAGGTVPSWIGRLATAAGTVVANFGENPSVTAIGFNVKIPGYQKLVDTAVKTRERITQRKIDRIVAGKAVNLGFMVIEAK